MPETLQREHRHPAKREGLLSDFEGTDVLIRLNCSLCRKSLYFLPADLVKILGPDHPIHKPPFDCSGCGGKQYMKVKTHSPSKGDYGHLPIRRLGPIKTVYTWKTVTLGDDVF